MQTSTYFPAVAHIVAELDDENDVPAALAPRRDGTRIVSGRLSSARAIQRLNVWRRLFAGWAELDPSIARSLRARLGRARRAEPNSSGAIRTEARIVSGREWYGTF
jgi:hypothetical protein